MQTSRASTSKVAIAQQSEYYRSNPATRVMIVSGSRSYYEEYLRKKDTERAFAKPPALLTDRNAYINFLEVQLERVSAACFAVQSYEDRFNDMQGLIVSLDERCASTAKLVALAQQCTEVQRKI
jgi:hypothetical protein